MVAKGSSAVVVLYALIELELAWIRRTRSSNWDLRWQACRRVGEKETDIGVLEEVEGSSASHDGRMGCQ